MERETRSSRKRKMNEDQGPSKKPKEEAKEPAKRGSRAKKTETEPSPSPSPSSSSSSPSPSPSASLAGGSWIPITEEVSYKRFGAPPLPSPTSIIAFDMDGTIIDTKSGAKFAKSSDDWVFLYPCIEEKFKKLAQDGAYLLIFTNQGGVAKDRKKLFPLQKKIDTFVSILNVPMDVIIAGGYDIYRKPATGMWDYIQRTVEIEGLGDIPKTFVGDAAGRPQGWDGKGAKKDFSCTDRKFALNANFDFKTPEEFFLGHPPAPFDLGFDPSKVPKQVLPSSLFQGKSPEMIVCVGFAASGKSSFSKKHFVSKGYVHVNRDTLGTIPKCKAAAKEALEQGKSVIIDNTNPSPQARADFTSIAKSLNVPCRCLWFNTPRDAAEHMNALRERTQGVKRVPGIAYNMYAKNFVAPSKSEGFADVLEIPFGVDFESEEARREFSLFTG